MKNSLKKEMLETLQTLAAQDRVLRNSRTTMRNLVLQALMAHGKEVSLPEDAAVVSFSPDGNIPIYGEVKTVRYDKEQDDVKVSIRSYDKDGQPAMYEVTTYEVFEPEDLAAALIKVGI